MKFIDFLNESKHKYTVDVEVRDASKANDIAKDMFRGAYKNDGSNVFVFKDEGDRDEFVAQLDKQKLKYDSLDEAKEKTAFTDYKKWEAAAKAAGKDIAIVKGTTSDEIMASVKGKPEYVGKWHGAKDNGKGYVFK